MKPKVYPLPWHDGLDLPYWQINLYLCRRRPGWSKWQTHRPMTEIIPEIDRLIGAVGKGDGNGR